MATPSKAGIRLGGYEAKTCPEKVRKSHHPDYADVVLDPIPTGDQARMDAGIVFESVIGKLWAGELADLMVSVDTCDRTARSKRHREKQTLSLMADPGNALVIWNARLPLVRNRVGEPDALLRIGTSDDGTPQWAPIDVKDHSSVEGTSSKNTVLASDLADPRPEVGQATDLIGTPRKSDALQLAHYQRMLEDLGFSAPGNIGGIIGRERVVVWHDLGHARYRHPEHGTISALQWYDQAFDQAVTIAANARAGIDETFVEKRSECASCIYRTTCHDELREANHITLLPGITPTRAGAYRASGVDKISDLAKLDYRTATLVDAKVPVGDLLEWASDVPRTTSVVDGIDGLKGASDMADALSGCGVTTAADVLTLCPSTAAASSHRPWNLAGSIDQARVHTVGKVHLARGVTSIGFVPARFEQDIDIEDENGYVYLIGVRDTGRKRVGEDLKVQSQYYAFANWDRTSDGEARIFAEFWAHVTHMREQAKRNRWGYRAYYYTHHEPVAFAKLAERHAGKRGVPTVSEVEEFFGHKDVIDLHPLLSKQMVWPTESMTLKDLAKWVRFSWRDEDPGGGNSLAWYADAVDHPDEEVRQANRERLLQYNADDVASQVAIRDWISRLGEAREPGAKLPNVERLDRRFRRKK